MLSIIVPVYNVKEYLIKCLDSINRQTYKDYEVIVMDDGSTDGSGELIDSYCADKPKFRVFHKENGGLMSAWMAAVKYAVGDYLGFVDSDDYIACNMYERLMETATEYDCDIVMCNRFNVDKKISCLLKSCIEPGLYTGEKMDVIYQNILPKFNTNHITNARWNKIFRREVFMSNTKYCEHLSRICEDRFITPACVFSAKSFYYLDEPLYYYVSREGSNHSKASDKLQDALALLYDTQMQMIKDKGLYEKYGTLIERANLNYLRLLITRNFSAKISTQKKIEYSKKILNNKSFNYCINKYPGDLTSKFGMALRIMFKVKSPLAFELMCRKVKE